MAMLYRPFISFPSCAPRRIATRRGVAAEFHPGLSPDIADRLDSLVETAALQLRIWGHVLEQVPRDDLSLSIR
jgi:hypothetical protein